MTPPLTLDPPHPVERQNALFMCALIELMEQAQIQEQAQEDICRFVETLFETRQLHHDQHLTPLSLKGDSMYYALGPGRGENQDLRIIPLPSSNTFDEADQAASAEVEKGILDCVFWIATDECIDSLRRDLAAIEKEHGL